MAAWKRARDNVLRPHVMPLRQSTKMAKAVLEVPQPAIGPVPSLTRYP